MKFISVPREPQTTEIQIKLEQFVEGAPNDGKIGKRSGKSVHGSTGRGSSKPRESTPVALLYVFTTSSADGHGKRAGGAAGGAWGDGWGGIGGGGRGMFAT